jgi:hypothetical protein
MKLVKEHMKTVRTQFLSTKENTVDHTGFLFRPIFNVFERNPELYFREIMRNILLLRFTTLKIMPGLFFILNEENEHTNITEPDAKQYDYDFTEPDSMCLFENMGFYKKYFHDVLSGGRERLLTQPRLSLKHSKEGYKNTNKKHTSLYKSPKRKTMKGLKINVQNKTPTPEINGQQMFYETVNGMPIFHVFDATPEKKNNRSRRSRSRGDDEKNSPK